MSYTELYNGIRFWKSVAGFGVVCACLLVMLVAHLIDKRDEKRRKVRLRKIFADRGERFPDDWK